MVLFIPNQDFVIELINHHLVPGQFISDTTRKNIRTTLRDINTEKGDGLAAVMLNATILAAVYKASVT